MNNRWVWLTLLWGLGVAPAGSHAQNYVFDTLAGRAGGGGGADGQGTAAQFSGPRGLAVDSAGNIYVADTFNSAIRKITPAGLVTTWAGALNRPGTNDGVGNTARFYFPSGITLDRAGNVFVADEGNHTIRKITPSGQVTTLAGQPGFGGFGSRDGTGDQAQFRDPFGVAADSAGNIFVAELYNIDDSQGGTVRKITPDGVVTTFAGSATNPPASIDGIGSTARFLGPTDVVVDNLSSVHPSGWGTSPRRLAL